MHAFCAVLHGKDGPFCFETLLFFKCRIQFWREVFYQWRSLQLWSHVARAFYREESLWPTFVGGLTLPKWVHFAFYSNKTLEVLDPELLHLMSHYRQHHQDWLITAVKQPECCCILTIRVGLFCVTNSQGHEGYFYKTSLSDMATPSI